MIRLHNMILFWPDISQKKRILMGFSIIMVVCYHALCWVYNPIWEFNLGYAGVDVFFFLSGYGLTASYNKNTIVTFYNNRFRRVYPLYFIAVVAAFFILRGGWNLQQLCENLLTIGLYADYGYNRFDWYVESLLGIYLLFPLFYFLRKLYWGG